MNIKRLLTTKLKHELLLSLRLRSYFYEYFLLEKYDCSWNKHPLENSYKSLVLPTVSKA